MIGIKLEKKKTMSITDEIKQYPTPKTIYIPLLMGSNPNVVACVGVGDSVKVGSKVAEVTKPFPLPIFSSVSGVVKEMTEVYSHQGMKVSALAIENDGQENCVFYEIPVLQNRQDFVELLQEKGIIGLSGNAFPTYKKYQGKENIKTLIVNGVECEPYITADYMLMKCYAEKIIEGMQQICAINHIEEAILAIKVNNDEIREIYQSKLKNNPLIRLVEVPNLYPMGWEKSLVQYIKHVDYKNLPIEKGIIVENIGTVYAIYEAITKGKPLYERVITFTGEEMKTPQNYWIKNGTLASDIIQTIGLKPKEDLVFIAGGPMMGESSPSEDMALTGVTNCILVLPFRKDPVKTTCLRCGKCVQVCPVKISPILVKGNLEDVETLRKLHVDRCIGCGLCSYICPAKIPVRNYVRKAKEQLQGGKR